MKNWWHGSANCLHIVSMWFQMLALRDRVKSRNINKHLACSLVALPSLFCSNIHFHILLRPFAFSQEVKQALTNKSGDSLCERRTSEFKANRQMKMVIIILCLMICKKKKIKTKQNPKPPKKSECQKVYHGTFEVFMILWFIYFIF